MTPGSSEPSCRFKLLEQAVYDRRGELPGDGIAAKDAGIDMQKFGSTH